MHIVLLQDVPGIGRKWDVKKVRDGHARNFLIPRHMAAASTAALLEDIARRKKTAEEGRKNLREKLKAIAQTLRDTTITVAKKAGEKGQLFAAVAPEEITEAIAQQTPLCVDPAYIHFGEQIKTAGTHQVQLRIPDEEPETFTLHVTAETLR